LLKIHRMKHDIRDKTDIELMMRTFYGSLLTNESISPVFEHTDFEAHMPHMIAFWSFVLLDEEGYKTNVFDKHVHLPIKEEHFDIWYSHFEKTVNDLFEGEKAELAKQRAQTIAYTFKMKMKQMGKI
jgi:hemoglobin